MAAKGYTEVRYGESQTNPLRRLRAAILLSSFKGLEKDIYRAVHNFKDNKFFFAQYAKEFFYKTHRMILEGKIREIRRLFVCTDESELSSDDSLRLLNCHTLNKGYHYKIIRKKDYEILLNEQNINPMIDFGIIGKSVFFEREQIDLILL